MMDICKENGAYDAKHFLCYYYYGGMIYTGLKNFERALYFFEQVLSQGFSLFFKDCSSLYIMRMTEKDSQISYCFALTLKSKH